MENFLYPLNRTNNPMDQTALSELRLRLYIDIIQNLALEDPSLTDIIDDITLGSLLACSPCTKDAIECSPAVADDSVHNKVAETSPLDSESRLRGISGFSEEELLMFGMPARRHLDISLRHRVVEEIQQVLHSMAQSFGGSETSPNEKNATVFATLPQRIQEFKGQIENKSQTVVSASQRIEEMIAQISQMHETLDRELRHAVSVTLPTHEATRSMSIDLLAATIETSLVKLSLARSRADRALYGHTPGRGTSSEGANVGKALEAAYLSLKKDEKEMRLQSQSLDRQLQEYESLMQLVDGGKGGYQQVVSDWTKVKQETDECLKDLRRLGWTGD